MKKTLLIAVTSTALLAASITCLKKGYAEDKRRDTPILRLNTGGHLGIINEAIATKDGQQLITASDDSMIRIWDTTTGKEIRKILGDNKIYAIALTPDERYLAVAGLISIDKNNYVIRIYDFSTGELLRILSSHTKAIQDLSISSDGKYLVSSSSDTSIKVWDIANDFILACTFQGHSAAVQEAKIFISGSDYQIVSVGFDKKIVLWSLQKKKAITEYLYKYKIGSVAVSSNLIAASVHDWNDILIFDKELNFKKNIQSRTIPVSLVFSPDGKLLLTGSNYGKALEKFSYQCDIFDTSKNFKKIENMTIYNEGMSKAITFLDNKRCVTCGGLNHNINIWDIKKGELTKKINGSGNIILSLGIKGDAIAFGYTPDKLKNFFSLGKKYKSKKLMPDFFKRTYTKFSNENSPSQKLYYYKIEKFAFGSSPDILRIFDVNLKEKRIIQDSQHLAYTITNKGIIISGGHWGELYAYSVKGEKIASLVGHTGSIRSLAVDGDRLISGGDDQIIKVWNLKELNKGKKKIYPVLNIFMSQDNEWVMWNEQGFYKASPKGDKFVGWHVNHGPDKSAEYYTAQQFRRYLYRPDIIKKTLELGSGELAINEMSKKEPGLRKITISELVKRAPVEVKIESIETSIFGYADIKVRLGRNKTTSPERITLYVNGGQVLTEKERSLKNAKPGDILNYRVRLTDSKNYIKVTVENQWAENTAYKSIDLSKKTQAVSYKDSTLYVVAVGIKNYPYLPQEQQLNSPPLDAKSIAEKFKKLDGSLYKNINVLLLTDDDDKKITSDMVEKALIEQTRKAGPIDTTVIFLAGHGVTDLKGNYHFITADTKIKSAIDIQESLNDNTNFSWNRLHKIIDSTMGKRIVIVDTCQAGEVFSETKTDISNLAKDIHDVNAIVYSGTSRQDSGLETKEGGVFTLSLLSGINGKAEYNDDFLPFKNLKEFVDKDLPARNEKIKKRQLARAIKLEIIKQENNDDDDNETQEPVAVIPDGMEGFIIYAK